MTKKHLSQQQQRKMSFGTYAKCKGQRTENVKRMDGGEMFARLREGNRELELKTKIKKKSLVLPQLRKPLGGGVSRPNRKKTKKRLSTEMVVPAARKIVKPRNELGQK